MAKVFVRRGIPYLTWQEGNLQRRQSLGRISVFEAETLRQAKELELRVGHAIFSPSPLFGELAAEYLKWHASEYPDSHYRIAQILAQHLLPAFQYQPCAELKPLQVEAYKRDRLKVVSIGSVAKEVRTLKAVLNKAVEWQVLRFNPVAKVRPPQGQLSRPPHWYSMEQLHELYRASGAFQPVWQLMANTGMRRSEALHLKREHVGPDAIQILSEPGARTKSRRWREIPLSDNARDALAALQRVDSVARKRLQRDYILPVMNPVSLSRAFSRTLPAGLGGSLHSLRHTFGTHMAIKGVSVRVLKELMGHASITTTERYMHVAAEHLREAVRGFNI